MIEVRGYLATARPSLGELPLVAWAKIEEIYHRSMSLMDAKAARKTAKELDDLYHQLWDEEMPGMNRAPAMELSQAELAALPMPPEMRAQLIADGWLDDPSA